MDGSIFVTDNRLIFHKVFLFIEGFKDVIEHKGFSRSTSHILVLIEVDEIALFSPSKAGHDFFHVSNPISRRGASSGIFEIKVIDIDIHSFLASFNTFGE